MENIWYNETETTKDKEKFQMYLKLAEEGNHIVQNNLGYCYQYGIGTEKNYNQAFQWYLKSAENGNRVGQFNIGYCYQFGIGTEKDEDKAFIYYQKAAEMNHYDGTHNYGRFVLKKYKN